MDTTNIKNTNIQNSFSLLPLNKQNFVIKLRGIILSSSIKIFETQKYGQITFATETEPVAFLCVKQNTEYVEVGFYKGIFLRDLNELLKEKSNEIRKIKFKAENEIPAIQIKRWVREAVSLQKNVPV